jgi:hypothetical protein
MKSRIHACVAVALAGMLTAAQRGANGVLSAPTTRSSRWRCPAARESIARGDIVAIKTAPMGWDSHNKAVLAAIGGGGGALAGYFLAYDFPRGEKGIYRGAYVGVPLGLGAGVATGLVIAGKYQQTIYRSGG